MKYRFMRRSRGRYSVREMAGVFGVSAGACYKRAKYGVSERRGKADCGLVSLIHGIAREHHFRYGSPRVRRELRAKHGRRVSGRKAARLMRENGLNAHRRRKFIPTTDSDHGLPVCENILNREFHAEQPGEKRVSDITCLRTRECRVYLTVIPGLSGRKVTGRALSNGMEAVNTAVAALLMAFANRKAPACLLFHSDRGVQYCAETFRDALLGKCPAVRRSMSRKGNCRNNACAESFSKTLKSELETPVASIRRLRSGSRYSYTLRRITIASGPHSAPDYVSPNVFNLGRSA